MRSLACTAVLAAAGLTACSAAVSRLEDETAALEAAARSSTDVRRVAGDLRIQAECLPGSGVDGADVWRCGRAAITTALPVGYPRPTPPGAVELKCYPAVRRAEVSGSGDPDVGRNIAFWPLLGHIQQREIAMTAPVEMDYPTLAGQGAETGRWTMSFLYREPAQGELGNDGSVRIVDQPALTVLAVGRIGDYSYESAARATEQLRAWLAGQEGWEAAGDPRALYYNGPQQRPAEKWSEVQIPVRPRTAR